MAFINLANLAMGILAILSVLYNWRIALKIALCIGAPTLRIMSPADAA
uniref:Inner membrane protein n=1 Tax=Macrostomum lignano TaxID=282301 RepID=A0A1I8HEQ7_9PLAT